MIGSDMLQLEGQTSAGVTIPKINFRSSQKRKQGMTINAFSSNIFQLFCLICLNNYAITSS